MSTKPAAGHLVNEQGRPFSAETFGNAFRGWAKAAGLTDCSPHGLRKAAASRLAEMGASAMEIAAVTGHRTLKEVARYTQGAAQRILAEAAFNRLPGSSSEEKKSHQSAPTLGWDENELQDTEKKDQTDELVRLSGEETNRIFDELVNWEQVLRDTSLAKPLPPSL